MSWSTTCTMLYMLVYMLLAVCSGFSNMNGKYVIANPNTHNAIQFSTDYNTKKVEYFEVYSYPIQTVYAQVYWTVQDPVFLPPAIIERFSNSTMAIVGYEADQVFQTSQGDVSVPIYWSYNHHYESWIVGKNSSKDTFQEIPASQYFSEGNGGEYRKSYHGYPDGYAQLVYSPQFFRLQPMQIDTHNRDYHGAGFKAGLLPKSSQAPPDASYSGLLECPCTTRINKTWHDTYTSLFNSTCPKQVTTPEECWKAVASIGLIPTTKRIVNSETLPNGCLVLATDLNSTVFFNTATKNVTCSKGSSSYAARQSSLVDIVLSIDTSVPGGIVQINLTGPSDVWFGVGFNAVMMKNMPYTIVVQGDGSVSEWKIGDHEPGMLLTPQVEVISTTVQDNKRTVALFRSINGLTSDHYTFDPSHNDIPFINAIGTNPAFSYHQSKAAGNLVLTAQNTLTCLCNNGMHSWINGLPFSKYCPDPPTSDLHQQKNPTCTIQSYSGGLFCCHHLNLLLDADQPIDDRVDTVFLKFRFYFQEYIPATTENPKPSHFNLHRFYYMTEAFAGEYDVPGCEVSTPPEDCIHEITARWQVKDMLDCDYKKEGCLGPNKLFQLVYAGGHCHAPSCISIELYNADTGMLICRQVPVWGQGVEPLFDEKGYLSIPPCLWGDPEEGLIPPFTLELDTNLISIKKNNNTYGHYGEMASWQMRGIFL